MLDFTGIQVLVGDIVVFVKPRERKLIQGEVLKLTPKGIRVGYYKSIGRGVFVEYTHFLNEGQFVVIDKA